MDVAANLLHIKENIKQACEKSNRSEDDVQIIAVTKYVSTDRAKEALEAGITHLGENRVEGFKKKYVELEKQATWHFIGTLQSRKVKEIIEEIDVIHSLDRISLAKEINKRADRVIPCFVQVNVSGEESKHGLNPEEVKPFIEQLEQFEKIKVIGLMTMAPFVKDEKILRSCFRQLRELQEEVEGLNLPYAPCHYLSMGMSNDYEIAIEEGATHIRIGTSLVGKNEEE